MAGEQQSIMVINKDMCTRS